MPRSGRPRKPTRLHLLHGTFRKDRALRNEIRPEVKPLRMPNWLTPEAKDVWRRLYPPLMQLRLLTVLDRIAFECLCTIAGEIEIARKAINCDGHFLTSPIRDRKGEVVGSRVYLNPAIRMERDAIKLLRMYAPEFGL